MEAYKNAQEDFNERLRAIKCFSISLSTYLGTKNPFDEMRRWLIDESR